MVLVLMVLCLLFSVLTLKEQTAEDNAAAIQLIEQIKNEFRKSDIILAVGAVNKNSAPFAEKLGAELGKEGYSNTQVVVGTTLRSPALKCWLLNPTCGPIFSSGPTCLRSWTGSWLSR